VIFALEIILPFYMRYSRWWAGGHSFGFAWQVPLIIGRLMLSRKSTLGACVLHTLHSRCTIFHIASLITQLAESNHLTFTAVVWGQERDNKAN